MFATPPPRAAPRPWKQLAAPCARARSRRARGARPSVTPAARRRRRSGGPARSSPGSAPALGTARLRPQRIRLCRVPGGSVHAVRHVSHRELERWPARKQALEYAAAHDAVQSAHAVDDGASADGEIGHVERLVCVVRILPSQRQQLAHGDAQTALRIVPEVALDQRGGLLRGLGEQRHDVLSRLPEPRARATACGRRPPRRRAGSRTQLTGCSERGGWSVPPTSQSLQLRRMGRRSGCPDYTAWTCALK